MCCIMCFVGTPKFCVYYSYQFTCICSKIIIVFEIVFCLGLSQHTPYYPSKFFVIVLIEFSAQTFVNLY